MSSKEKTYILDTSVIVEDPNIIEKISSNIDIVIPDTVLKELNSLKIGTSKISKNVRDFVRLISKDILNTPNLSFCTSPGTEGMANDEKIIDSAKYFHNPIIVTNDILMGLLARSNKIDTVRWDRPERKELYSGIRDSRKVVDEGVSLNPNEYTIKKDGLYRAVGDKELVRLTKDRVVWGLRHKSVEQRCAIDALMDDSIKLVTLSGKAGTGKTLLAIAAGLEKTLTEGKYQNILISRPIIPMGKDVGFLPGELYEKLEPWMHPIFDNINFLFRKKEKGSKEVHQTLLDDGLLKVEPLTFIRGRSIPNKFMIIDEAQNLTQHEVKAILSRAGEGTKIVMTGDVEQIDNQKLNKKENGLSYIVEKFKTEPIAAHITFTKCERSELADISSRIL